MNKLSFELTLSKDQSILDLLDSSFQSTHSSPIRKTLDSNPQDQADQCALAKQISDELSKMSKDTYHLPQHLRHDLRYGDSQNLSYQPHQHYQPNQSWHSQEHHALNFAGPQKEDNFSLGSSSQSNLVKTPQFSDESVGVGAVVKLKNISPSDSCSVEENTQIQHDFAEILNQAEGMDRTISYLLNHWTESDLKIQNHVASNKNAVTPSKVAVSPCKSASVEQKLDLHADSAFDNRAQESLDFDSSISFGATSHSPNREDLGQASAVKSQPNFFLERDCAKEQVSLISNLTQHTSATCQHVQDRLARHIHQDCHSFNQRFFVPAHKSASAPLNSCEHDQFEAESAFLAIDQDLIQSSLGNPVCSPCLDEPLATLATHGDLDLDAHVASLQALAYSSVESQQVELESQQIDSKQVLAPDMASAVGSNRQLSFQHAQTRTQELGCFKTTTGCAPQNFQQDTRKICDFQEHTTMLNQAPWVLAQNTDPNQDFTQDKFQLPVATERGSLDAVTACLVLMLEETDNSCEHNLAQDKATVQRVAKATVQNAESAPPLVSTQATKSAQSVISASEYAGATSAVTAQKAESASEPYLEPALVKSSQSASLMSRDTLQNQMYLIKAARALKQTQTNDSVGELSLDHSAKTEYYLNVASGQIGQGSANLDADREMLDTSAPSTQEESRESKSRVAQVFNELSHNMAILSHQDSKIERVLLQEKERPTKLTRLYKSIRRQESSSSLHPALSFQATSNGVAQAHSSKAYPAKAHSSWRGSSRSLVSALAKEFPRGTEINHTTASSHDYVGQTSECAPRLLNDQPHLQNTTWSIELVISGRVNQSGKANLSGSAVSWQATDNLPASQHLSNEIGSGHSLLKSFLNKFKAPADRETVKHRSALYFVGSSHYMWSDASFCSSDMQEISHCPDNTTKSGGSEHVVCPQVEVSGADRGFFKTFVDHTASFFADLNFGFEHFATSQLSLSFSGASYVSEVKSDAYKLWSHDFLGLADLSLENSKVYGLVTDSLSLVGHSTAGALPWANNNLSLALTDMHMGVIETYNALVEATVSLIGDVKALSLWAYQNLLFSKELMWDAGLDYRYFQHEVAFDPSLEHNNVAKVGSNVPEATTSPVSQASLGVASLMGMPMLDMSSPELLQDQVTPNFEQLVRLEKADDVSSVSLESDSSQTALSPVHIAPPELAQNNLHHNGQLTLDLAAKNDRILKDAHNHGDFNPFVRKGQDSRVEFSLEQQDNIPSCSCEKVEQPIQGEVLNNMTSLSADDSKQEPLVSPREDKQDSAQDKESKSLQASYGPRKVLFAQGFGIQEEAQQRQDYASAFKVGDLETVFKDIKERASTQEWGEKLNCASLVSKLAVHVCSRWLKRRCSKLAMQAPHDIQDSETEIYYDTVCLLIQTMLFAMRADDKIHTDERQALYDFCLSLFGTQITNIRGEIDRCLTMPLDLSYIASRICYAEERVDIFVLSAVILRENSFIFESYLENLAAVLEIDPSLARCLRYRAHQLIELDRNELSFKDLDRLYNENRSIVSSLAHGNSLVQA